MLSSGLDYFTGRLTQAPEDADFALSWVVKHANTREQQDLAHAALRANAISSGPNSNALYFSYGKSAWPRPALSSPARKAHDSRLQSHPQLVPGVRLSENKQQRVLAHARTRPRLNAPASKRPALRRQTHRARIITDRSNLLKGRNPRK